MNRSEKASRFGFTTAALAGALATAAGAASAQTYSASINLYNNNTIPSGVTIDVIHVSDETDARLKAGGHKLRADEWRGGDHAWLIELVAPFGGQDEVLADLAVSVFKGRPFSFHQVRDGQRTVATFDPAALNT